MSHRRSRKRRKDEGVFADVPGLEPELRAEKDGLLLEVYQVDVRAAGWRTRLAMFRAWMWGRLGVHRWAAQATREVIPAIPKSAWLAVWVAQMLARHGRPEEACAVYCELQRLPPGHFEAYATLGRYLMSVSRHARAVAFLREAVRLQPIDPELKLHYQEALLVAGLPDDRG